MKDNRHRYRVLFSDMMVQISVADCENKCEIVGNINEGMKENE